MGQRSKHERGGHSAWLSHGWKYFSISFHFSEDVQTKISATYVEVKVCYSRLVLVKMVLQLMSQLTYSIKGRTGNYFGTCKHKKGHGVKREENVYRWALSGEAKSILSLPPRHGPLPTGELSTESPPLPSPSHSERDDMLFSRLIPG